MESAYTAEMLPVPNGPRVRIRTIEFRTVAVKRYSGRGTGRHCETKKVELLKALEADGIDTFSEPMLARYNCPGTPWFMRRNEVIVEIDRSGSDGKPE